MSNIYKFLYERRRRTKISNFSKFNMKLKPLMPSLREKKRYIAFQVESKKEVTFSDAKKSIESTMLRFLGELGTAKVGVLFLKDWKNQTGIMRVNTKYVDETKATIALVKEINSQKASVKSVKVSGVLEKIRSSCF